MMALRPLLYVDRKAAAREEGVRGMLDHPVAWLAYALQLFFVSLFPVHAVPHHVRQR